MSRKKKLAGTARSSIADMYFCWYKSKGPILCFGLQLGILLIIFYGLMALPFFDRVLYAYLKTNAWLFWLGWNELYGQFSRALGQMAFITQLGTSFSVPVLIYFLVTFRREHI